MFLLTLIFEFASGIAGIAFIATSIHAGQVAPSELRIYSM
jgi:hypothetical protein